MHFVVSWDINNADDEWEHINSQLQKCLGEEEEDWVCPVSTFYIIRVSDLQEWKEIGEDLRNVAENSIAEIHFVISPLIQGGQYNGWLPRKDWPKIQRITDNGRRQRQRIHYSR